MKAINIYFILLLFFSIIEVESHELRYKCGADKSKIKVKPAKHYKKVDKNDPAYKRRIDSSEDGFKDFNIYLDTENIEKQIQEFNLQSYESLFLKAMNKAIETIQSLLKAKELSREITFTDDDISQLPIEVWDKTKIGSSATSDMKSLGIDLIIMGYFNNELDDSILASASPAYYDQETFRPIIGVVKINPNIDFSKLNSEKAFQTVILHEFTHILGFTAQYFKDLKFVTSQPDSDGINRYYLNSPKVVEVAKKYFNCDNIKEVPLEESDDETGSSHWEARVFLGEYMNSVTYHEEEVISEFTLAYLEDTKFYKANYYTGGLMRYGKGKGCKFVQQKCVNEQEVDSLFKNEFFSSVLSDLNVDASCSSGRLSRTYHYLTTYDEAIPEAYQYFGSETKGGYESADYCPVSRGITDENDIAYYVGSCTTKGSGEYGIGIRYHGEEVIKNSTHTTTRYFNYYNKSGDITDITGESFSEQSFCYQSTLLKDGLSFNNSVPRAICYESFCSDSSLTIKIKDDYFVCPRAGGKIEVEGYSGYFLCADYNLICSGTVMCNDLFDCVEKKSEPKKESYNYDYTIATNQNLKDAGTTSVDNTNNYELSENGICPKDCKQCQENKKCTKCRDEYVLLGSKEREEINCVEQNTVSIGYYQENNIYYPCIENCEHCKNGTSCEKCSSGFQAVDGMCITAIEHCAEYDTKESVCAKCEDNYAIKEDDKTNCLELSNFENYYTKDNGISYYPCENENSDCSKCYYKEEKSEVICYLCKVDLILSLGFDDTKEECITESSIDETLCKLNDTHITKCSNLIENCLEYEDGTSCSKCNASFYMINDDKTKCEAEANIAKDEYYLNEDSTMFYACNNSDYHDVPNCKKCSEKTSCSLCQDKYAFVNGNKTLCVDISTLGGDKYILDPKDETNYIQCSNLYSNCDTCNNEKCLTCLDGFDFIDEDYTNCVSKSSPSTATNAQTDTPTNTPTNVPTNVPTNAPTNAPTNKPTNAATDAQIIITTIASTSKESENKEEKEAYENAEEKASLTLSFYQINNFKNDKSKKTISFDLSVLTSEGQVNSGDVIKVNVNLIHTNGTRDSSSTESECTLKDTKSSSGSVKAIFSCNINNIEGDYYSLRYNNSLNISGVPNDEVSLDPVMTDKYKNTDETKIIPTFTFESVKHDSCETDGVFTITGTLSEKLDQAIKFNLPLTYPEGIISSCELNKEQTEIECKVDREIDGKNIIIEQTVIKQGNDDYFNLKSITSEDELTCLNGALQDSFKRESIPVSFRQVSHFEKSTNGFSFYLIALSSEKLDKRKNITINVICNNEEKQVNCILEDSVNPKAQGNFLCSVDKSKDEDWKSANLDSISVSISPNNDMISGVSDLDETISNPAKTDEEIKKNKEKLEKNEAVNALTNVVDYYSEKVEVNALTLDAINMDKCNTLGKLTLTGTFSNDIEESVNFDLSLTYPSAEIKCELNSIQKNVKTNIACKTKTEINSIQNIVIESRIIKKKNQELFYIQGKTFNLTEETTCGKYDTIKKQLIDKRQSTGLFFGLTGKISLVNNIIKFFMALTRKSSQITFINPYKFISAFTFSTRRILRNLDENTYSDVEVTCNLNDSLTLDLTGGYDCASESGDYKGTPTSLEVDADQVDGISGIEKINSPTNSTIDYSNKDNLQKLNDLPVVTIKSINGDTCSEDGQFNITGTISDISNLEDSYSNVEIMLSSPESTGLCEVEINKSDKSITMTCENRDKFDMSQIIIDRSLIQDSEGNYIFTLDSYTSAEQIACDISLNSVKITESSSTTDSSDDSEFEDSIGNNFSKSQKSSGGLSGGTIAAIAVSCVAAVVITTVLIVLVKKGILFSGSNKHIIEQSSINGQLNNDIKNFA